MDNTEYTIKKDEIRSLIAQKEYVQAMEIADTIDWRRVRSVMMLCTISDLYKINRRYEDAKNMLLLAYEYRPGGRSICYSLCELCIKMEEFVQAVAYYKEFVQAAPKDPDRYVLQYKLYEAQDVSLEERIEILKELKQKEYREKWAYELAYLYHRIGQATLCVEECDELILWFGEGKYVYKAMELKMLHQPLSPSQQEKYEHRSDGIKVRESAPKAPQKVVYPQPREQSQGHVPQTHEQVQGYMQSQGYVPQTREQGQGYTQQRGYEQGQGYVPQTHEQGQGYVQQQIHEQLQRNVQSQGYEQLQGNKQSQGNKQLQGYEQGQGYVQPQGYEQGQGYVQPQGYEQGQGYMQSQGYEQSQGYVQQQIYEMLQRSVQPQGYEHLQGNKQSQGNKQLQGYEQGQGYVQPQGYEQDQGYVQPQIQEMLQKNVQPQGYEHLQGNKQSQGNMKLQGYEQGQGYVRPQGYEQSQGYLQQQVHEQLQGNKQSQGNVKLQGYEQGRGYEQPQGYEQSQSYEQPQDYEQGWGYEQGQGYEQPQDYEQGQDYAQSQGYGKSQIYIQQAREQEQGYGQERGYYDRQPSHTYEQPRKHEQVREETLPQISPEPEVAERFARMQSSFEEQDFEDARNLISAEAEQGSNDKTSENEIQVPIMDMGQYNTMNLQAEIAAGLQEILEKENKTHEEITRSILAPMLESDTGRLDGLDVEELDEDELDVDTGEVEETEVFFGETGEINSARFGGLKEIVPEMGNGKAREIVPEMSSVQTPELDAARGTSMSSGRTPELDVARGGNMGSAWASELDAARGGNMNSVRTSENAAREGNVGSVRTPEMDAAQGTNMGAVRNSGVESVQVSDSGSAQTFDVDGDTKVFEIVRTKNNTRKQASEESRGGANSRPEEDSRLRADRGTAAGETAPDMMQSGGAPDVRQMADATAELVMNQMRMENRAEAQAMIAQPPKELANVLSQESDGQISLVMPERETVEKQITGQMSIEDILAEWERIKQETAERRKAELQQRVLQQTGNMFTEFEAAVRDGLLEKLESEMDQELGDAPMQEELEDIGEVEELEEILDLDDAATLKDFIVPQVPEELEILEEYEVASNPEMYEESNLTPQQEILEVPAVKPQMSGKPVPAFKQEIAEEPESASELEIAEEPEPASKPEKSEGSAPSSKQETSEEPALSSKQETSAESVPASKPETSAEPAPSSKQETSAEPAPASKPETSAEPAPASKPETPVESAPSSKQETPKESVLASKPETIEESEQASKPEMPTEPVPASKPETIEESEQASRPETPEESAPSPKQETPEKSVPASDPGIAEQSGAPAKSENFVEPSKSGMTEEAQAAVGSKTLLKPQAPEQPVEAEETEKHETPIKAEVTEERAAPSKAEVIQEHKTPTRAEAIQERKTPTKAEVIQELETPSKAEVAEEHKTPSAAEAAEQVEAFAEPVSPARRAKSGVVEGPWAAAGQQSLAEPEEYASYDTGENTDYAEEESTETIETVQQEDQYQPYEEQERPPVRKLTLEERELYAPYIQSRSAREQLVKAIDNISMAASTGNIVITGDEGLNTITLAKNMIREVQMKDGNFSGKVAKISGEGLNQRNVRETLEQLKNGALIIQKASGIDTRTAAELAQFLRQENVGIIIVMEDTKKAITKLFAENPRLKVSFTAWMDVEALSNDTLASFGMKYARQMEYSIDDLGMLALHKRIEELQTIDHVVTVVEVKNIVDNAIRRASKKSVGHFMDILLAKRYDEEDMIILTEKDFV